MSVGAVTAGEDRMATDVTDAPHVAMIIPRGEVIRNFVYTDCIQEVAAVAGVSLLSVLEDGELGSLLRTRFRRVFGLREVEEPWIVRIQRDLLDLAHGRWLWSRAAERRWKIRDMEARSMTQKAKRLAKKAASLPFASRAGLRTLSFIERSTSRLAGSSNEYLDLYRQIRPSLVFNGSHIHSRNAIQAVQAAQWLGIPTATFIFSWDNLTSQGRIILPYDYFLVWNEELKAQLLEMYDWIKPENVFVTGTPQFDFHFRPEFYLSREEFCTQVGADPGRPIVSYATGMPNHMPGEPEIVEDIADALLEYDEVIRPQLLVRVYPKDRSGRFEELKARRPDILFPRIEWEEAWLTPKYDDSYALVNTLRHSAVGINVASTVSLELCMFDKPVINVGYNPSSVDVQQLAYADYYEFDHYKPVVESGAVYLAKSRWEMREALAQSIAVPEERSRERKNMIDGMFGAMLDGQSSRRVAETLLALSGQGH